MYFYKNYRGQTAGRVLYGLEVYCSKEMPNIASNAIVYDSYVKVIGIPGQVLCTFYWQDEVPVFIFNKDIDLNLITKFERNQKLLSPFLDSTVDHSLLSVILKEAKRHAVADKLERIFERNNEEILNLLSVIEETGNGYINAEELLDHIIYCLI